MLKPIRRVVGAFKFVCVPFSLNYYAVLHTKIVTAGCYIIIIINNYSILSFIKLKHIYLVTGLTTTFISAGNTLFCLKLLKKVVKEILQYNLFFRKNAHISSNFDIMSQRMHYARVHL